ncbi:tripartite tricarboxylate transporter substrate binding protein [Jiangella asiatica]|uniref:tripartite tricarboxylate transporter substrate binding protein n=1 Tax=Jiangella asiatica TaxID=2530372 RepID=UPI0013A5C5C8|nr:tripartite tricarboxylate transporter substrate binding protein [Jiangella asiatica]
MAISVLAVGVAATACGSTTGETSSDGAAGYPERAITFLVPFDTGGSSDLTARAIAPALEQELGQPVNIVNKGAAGGVTGLTELMNAKSDGYTIGLAASGQFSVAPLTADVPYTIDDFAGYVGLIEEANMLTVNASSEWQDFDDLVDAFERGETIQFGHSADLLRLIQARVFTDAGIEATGIPFSSGGESNTALLAGDVDVIAQSLAAGVPMVENGQTRFLATFASERLESYPDVPTLAELGYDAGQSVARKFILVPKDTPPEIVAVIEETATAAMQDATYKEFVASSSSSLPEDVTGDALKEQLDTERSTYESWMEELDTVQ